MKKVFKVLFLFLFFAGVANVTFAQKKKAKKAPVATRKKTTRSTKNKTKTSVTGADVSTDAAAVAPAGDADLIIKDVKKSRRRDAAVD
jgi:uncharacterized membrane protein